MNWIGKALEWIGMFIINHPIWSGIIAIILITAIAKIIIWLKNS